MHASNEAITPGARRRTGREDVSGGFFSGVSALWLPLALALALGASPAAAAIIGISGTFDADFDTPVQGGIANVAGSFSLTFDDSVVVGSGSEAFSGLTPDSFSMTPDPLGIVSFGTGNTNARVAYEGGVLVGIILTGDPGGGCEPGIGPSCDDFLLEWATTLGELGVAALDINDVTISVATEASLAQNFNGSAGAQTLTIDVSVVPEPGTATLLGLGLASLAARRRAAIA